MASYQANRQGSNENQSEDQRNAQNNAKNLRNAADVAIASKNPYAMAAGGAVKAADKLTGGKATEAAGKALNKIGKRLPAGKKLQNASNKLGESGASDAIGKAASLKNAGGAGNVPNAQGSPNVPSQVGETGSENNQGQDPADSIAGMPPFSRKKKDKQKDENDSGEQEGNLSGKITAKVAIKIALFTIVPFILIIFLLIIVITVVTSNFSDYEDAFGASQASGAETGGIVFSTSNKEAAAFYERINDVKLSMQSNGKNVDALKVVAVYHVINQEKSIPYRDMTTDKIEEIANAMFDGNSYNETTFKENLINDIFPKYVPNATESKRKRMAEDVFKYIENYYSLIGKNTSACASAGSCIYNIKGFYYSGSNHEQNLQITDLKVRLMQCGGSFGGGTWGKPLEGEELVPFETYILGVTYQEIGPEAPDEAQKAMMVAARSYSLSRPASMNNARGLKLEEENGQWILQLASCVADQVYCNPDQGCSAKNDGEQYGTVISGTSGAKKFKDPLAEDHKLRTLAAEVQGEVLVNDQGYIINAGYTSTEQNKFSSLANQGMNYKQILLEVYNSGSRNYGASDIDKMSCNNGNSSGCANTASGPYASWKQGGSPWSNIKIGNTSQTIGEVGCLVTSVSMLIAKSGVDTVIDDFNPGTFVEYLNSHGGFQGANFVWASAQTVAPSFVHQGEVGLSGYTRSQKLSKIRELVNQGYYVVVEVKGNTGQHWVAVDSVSSDKITMMDPGSNATDMWSQYPWQNTSKLHYYKAG